MISAFQLLIGIDNYVPQPCLFENIALFFGHNDYVLSRRDSLIVNYKHQFVSVLTKADSPNLCLSIREYAAFLL